MVALIFYAMPHILNGNVEQAASRFLNAASDHFWRGLLLQIVFVRVLWFWFDFMRYGRRRTYFALGVVFAGYPSMLLFGQIAVFQDRSGEHWATYAVVVLCYSLIGAMSLLALHLTAYRRLR